VVGATSSEGSLLYTPKVMHAATMKTSGLLGDQCRCRKQLGVNGKIQHCGHVLRTDGVVDVAFIRISHMHGSDRWDGRRIECIRDESNKVGIRRNLVEDRRPRQMNDVCVSSYNCEPRAACSCNPS